MLQYPSARLATLTLALTGCSLLFAPSEETVVDAGDVVVEDADAAQENPDFDFEDGLSPWTATGDCTEEQDPHDPNNQVVCCTASGLDNAYIAVGIEPSDHVVVEFRVLPEFGPTNGPNSMYNFSPFVGLTDDNMVSGINHTLLTNMNFYEDGGVQVVSFPVDSEIADGYEFGAWHQVRLAASVAEGCQFSGELASLANPTRVRVAATQGAPDETRGNFSVLLLGIVRHGQDLGDVRRCFDDVRVRKTDMCEASDKL